MLIYRDHALPVFCFMLLGIGRVVNLYVPRTLGAIVDDFTTGQGKSIIGNYCLIVL